MVTKLDNYYIETNKKNDKKMFRAYDNVGVYKLKICNCKTFYFGKANSVIKTCLSKTKLKKPVFVSQIILNLPIYQYFLSILFISLFNLVAEVFLPLALMEINHTIIFDTHKKT